MSTISLFVRSSQACLSLSSFSILNLPNPPFFTFYNTAFKSQKTSWSSAKFLMMVSPEQSNLVLDKYEGFDMQKMLYFSDYSLFSNDVVALLAATWGDNSNALVSRCSRVAQTPVLPLNDH